MSVRDAVVARTARLVRSLATLAIACACGLAPAGCGSSKGKAATAVESSARAGSKSTGTASVGKQSTPTGEAASSREISAREVAAASGGLVATLHVSGGHHPRVGERWPIAFTVRRAGNPARAEVSYEYLFGGAVVAHRSHYRFTGDFHDVFNWPASAVGYPLTFRAVIASGGKTFNLDYPVQVRR